MQDNILGTVEFTLGGISRRVNVKIGLAPEVETAAGAGILTLARAAYDGSIRFGQAVEVVRVALAGEKVVYTSAAVTTMAAREGVTDTIRTAARILNQFFQVPADAVSGKELGSPTAEPASP